MSTRDSRVQRRQFPNVWLQTESGRAVRFYDDLVRDRAVVIAFMYTRCQGTCPATSATMARLQKVFGDRMARDLSFLSITLDPVRDRPADLRKYAADVGAGPGWRFLTGQPGDIEAVRLNLGVRDPDPAIDRDRTQHAAVLTFGNDRTGRWCALPAPMRTEFLASTILRICG